MTKALAHVLPRRRTTAAGTWSWIRQIGSAPEIQPVSLAGSPSGIVLTVASFVAIVAVTGLEIFTPASASIGSLTFIPVLIAAWFLGAPEALAVAAFAAAARLVSYSTAAIDPGTAVAEIATLVAVATITRGAAVGFVQARERRMRAVQDKQTLELLAQRERIAVNVTNAAIRRLFAVTLYLEAVAARANDPSVKPTLDQAIAEVDALTTEFRTLVFGDGPAQTEATAEKTPIALK